ncbi:MAG: hypothetical protein FNP40_12300 [Dehalobacter sp. 4CP]|uniref:hypothetical protein n=1 Tax=Dehalobacter sp. CP TaxID=2594474 RepID=UPI0013C76A46|nr:hypothetical protein [Dehalobacter sp. 4CP]
MKKRLFLLFMTLVLNLILVNNVFATMISADGYKIYTGWNADYGLKSFRIETSYDGNQYTQSNIQYVDGHQYIAYMINNYNPEIVTGQASMQNLRLINSSGSTVSTLTTGNFYPGWLYSYLFPINTVIFKSMYSYSWLQGPAGNYTANVTTIYTNPDYGIAGTYSCSSSTF